MGDATRGSPIPLQAHIISSLDSFHKSLYVKNLSFAAYPLTPLVLESELLSWAPPHPPPRISAPAFLLVSGRSWAVAKLTHQRGRRGLEEVWKRFGRGLEEVFSAFSSKSCKNSLLRLLGMPMGMRCVYRPTAVRLSLEFDVQRC